MKGNWPACVHRIIAPGAEGELREGGCRPLDGEIDQGVSRGMQPGIQAHQDLHQQLTPVCILLISVKIMRMKEGWLDPYLRAQLQVGCVWQWTVQTEAQRAMQAKAEVQK